MKSTWLGFSYFRSLATISMCIIVHQEFTYKVCYGHKYSHNEIDENYRSLETTDNYYSGLNLRTKLLNCLPGTFT